MRSGSTLCDVNLIRHRCKSANTCALLPELSNNNNNDFECIDSLSIFHFKETRYFALINFYGRDFSGRRD